MKVMYARVSQDRTGTSTSVPDQLREMRAFCQKRGWTDVVEFSDNDISASMGKPRPGWNKLLGSMEEITDLVCWNTDRLYRQPRDLERIITQAEKGALVVHSLHQGEVDLRTPEGRAIARTLVAWSLAEVEKLSARIKRKLRSLEAEGKHGGGPRRYGYAADGMTIVPEEAQVLRDAATALLRGATLKSIVRDLTARGIV